MDEDVCGAKSSFCGKLNASKIETRQDGPTLEERIDKDVINVMGKHQKWQIGKECGMQVPDTKKKKPKKQHVVLAGGGQKLFSLKDSSVMLMQRDYPKLFNFNGTEEIGLIMVPSNVIPKYAINLDRANIEKAIKAAGQYEEYKKLAYDLKKAQKADVGDIPEENALFGLEKAMKDALCALIIHSLELFHPDLSPGKQEFDFYAPHFESLTLFAVEVKATLGNHKPPGSENETVAEKVCKQLMKGKEFIEQWFGRDLCKDWIFKPIVYCEKVRDDIKPLCSVCINDYVAVGVNELVRIIQDHIKTHKREKFSDKHVKDFKFMAQYLLFGLTAKNLPTCGRYGNEVSKYMDKVGSWDSILLWCFLTPGQMNVLSEPKLVFYSGWGGGKTITGLEACKLWSKEGKVLILVNGFKTHGQTMPLVLRLRMMLKGFENIEVKQIDLDKDSVDDLQMLTKGVYALFLDEFPGDKATLDSKQFQSKVKVMVHDKDKVWVAISNFDKGSASGEHDVSKELRTVFPGFEIITTLSTNLRNPMDVIEQVSNSTAKTTGEVDRLYSNDTVTALNKKMKSPKDLCRPTKDDPQAVLKKVFIDRTMKAVIATYHPEDALVLSNILKIVYGLDHVALTLKSDPKDVTNWLQWNAFSDAPNTLVTWKPMMNGIETELVISAEDEDETRLGDIVSRTTHQFINFETFFQFLGDMAIKDGCFEVKRSKKQSLLTSSRLTDMIYNHLSGSEQMTKEDFTKTLQKPSDIYSLGLMEILFKASVHLSLCFQLISFDSSSGQVKTLNLCSGAHHENETTCSKRLRFTCSVSQWFLLLMDYRIINDKRQVLSPQNLMDCLKCHMNSLRLGYTRHQILDEEVVVTINNGQALVKVVKGLDPTCICYLHDPMERTFLFLLRKFYNVFSRHFTPFNENEGYDLFFYDATELNMFLRGSIKFKMMGKRVVVINFKRSSIIEDVPDFVTLIECPLRETDFKILQMLGFSEFNTKTALNGKTLIQDDPLNGVAMLDNALVYYGYVTFSKSIKFLEFFDSEDIFNHCILPLFEEYGLVNESNKVQLKHLSLEFWISFKNASMDYASRKSDVVTLLQAAATLFNRNIDFITSNRGWKWFEPSLVDTIKPRGVKLSEATISSAINVLYIFDKEEVYMNGFVILSKKSCSPMFNFDSD